MTEIEKLIAYVRSLDEGIDGLLPFIANGVKKEHPIRYKFAYRLLNQTVTIAKSINRLTKISTEIDLTAVNENAQAILALLRVLVEASNKFYYIAIDSADDHELKLRWSYFVFVGCVRYEKMLKTSGSSETDPANISFFDKARANIERTKADLVAAGLAKWPAFVALKEGRKKQVLAGETLTDYVKEDYDPARARRLQPMMRIHFEELGNASVHSSSFVHFYRDFKEEKKDSFLAGVTAISVLNASRHLALCGLEYLHVFPVLKALIDEATIKKWNELVGVLKSDDHLAGSVVLKET